MPSTITRKGDTFDLIARRVYGDDQLAGLVASANPGAVEPFEAGVILKVPQVAAEPQQSSPSDDPDEVAVRINGTRFRYWTDVSITRSIDAVSTLSLGAPFSKDDLDFRAMFRPFSYALVEVTVGGAPLFTGTMLQVNPRTEEGGRTVSVDCYAVPGVLGDCTAPASMYPLEWDGSGLRAIAEALTAPFGIAVSFGEGADEGAVFERVALKPGELVLPFLIKLAQQRGLLVGSTATGALLFTAATTPGNPVASLTEGAAPLLGVTPSFDSQAYFSDITGIEPVFVGLKGSQATRKNTHLSDTLRPYTFEAPDTLDADVGAAVEAKLGRMFAGAVSYSVPVATWRDPDGKLWEENTTLRLTAPGAMVYKEYEFLIRDVSLGVSASDGRVAQLTLTLPGAFRSEVPETLPWE